MMLYALLILSISGSVIGKKLDHVYEPRHCSEIQAMENFDVSKFLGVWYYIAAASYPNGLNAKCYSYNLSLNQNNSIRSIFTEIRLRDGIMLSHLEKWRIDPANAAKIWVTSAKNRNETHISVLDTDYVSYAFVHKCINAGLQHVQYAWLYARERNPPASVMTTGDSLIDKFKIPKKNFKTAVQTDCTLHPFK